MGVSEAAAAGSLPQHAAQTEEGEETESEDNEEVITEEKQETEGMKVVLEMLGEIIPRIRCLEARTSRQE